VGEVIEKKLGLRDNVVNLPSTPVGLENTIIVPGHPGLPQRFEMLTKLLH